MRSKRTFLLAGLAGLALGGMQHGVAAAQDGFQLPPSPGSTGTVQGPVAEGVPPPRSPQPTPSPTLESRPTQAVDPIEIPAPAASASPSSAASPAAGTGPTAEPPSATSPSPTALETADAENEAAEEPVEEAAPAGTAEPVGTPQAPYPAQVPLDPLPEPELETGQQGWSIPWVLVFLALLALAGAGAALWWWRRESTGREIFVIPTIQRPRPVDRKIAPETEGSSPSGSRAASSAPPDNTLQEEREGEEDAPVNPLRVALEPRQLRLSLVNATLSYRLLLTNSGEVPLTDIAISGDMISAHSSLSREQQVAAPNQPLEPIQTIDRLAAGESRTVSGQFQLPLPMIRPIRRGEIALFVPLARLSIVARGENGGQPTVITSVVGQIPPRGAQGLQPFRLDLGPRTYSDLSQRAFA